MDALNLPEVKDESTFRNFLETVDAELERVDFEKTRVDWAKKWGEAFDEKAAAKSESSLDQVFTQKNHDLILNWGAKVTDPLLKRWVEVLDWKFKFQMIDQEPELLRVKNHIADRYIVWRPSLDGKTIPYSEQSMILRHNADRSLREKVWMAQWDLHNELNEDTRLMFQMRNEGAKQYGFKTLGDMQLASDGVDREWLLKFVSQMEEATRTAYYDHMNAQAEIAGIDTIQPWDIRYFFEMAWPGKQYFPAEGLNDSVDTFARSLGLDPDKMGIQLYSFDSPYGGQCVKYAPKDIRILTGFNDGMQYYKTAYHEYGHALHAWFSEPTFSLRAEPGMFTEGVAEILSMYLHYPTWLRRLGLPEEEIKRYQETRRLLLMYRDRSICADSVAELRVWDDPMGDSTEIYGKVSTELLGGAEIPQPFASVPRWTNPMRMHSYFIADAVSSQTHAALRRDFGEVFDNPEPMQHIIEHYLKPGGTVHWLEKIRRATGEDLTFDYLGEQLTQPFPEV